MKKKKKKKHAMKQRLKLLSSLQVALLAFFSLSIVFHINLYHVAVTVEGPRAIQVGDYEKSLEVLCVVNAPID